MLRPLLRRAQRRARQRRAARTPRRAALDDAPGEQLRELFEERLDAARARRPRPRDAGLPHLDGAAPRSTVTPPGRPGAAAAELVGLHGDVDAGRATL